jgi:hypothetical protein
MTEWIGSGQVIWEVIIRAGSGCTCPNPLGGGFMSTTVWMDIISAHESICCLHLHPLYPNRSTDNASTPRTLLIPVPLLQLN